MQIERIDIHEGNKDLRPGSLFRALVENLLLPYKWDEYVTIYIKNYGNPTGVFFSNYKIHNEDGPAAVKLDGTMEWWLDGKKLFVTTQKEFECYMRNKAFW
jgi:hypothetical protein